MVDVAPTLLHVMGIPVPDTMDGKVLTEILDPSLLAANPVRRGEPLEGTGRDSSAYSEDEMAEVSGRLAALGYIE